MYPTPNAHLKRLASVKVALNCPTYYLLSRREKYVWGLKPSPRRIDDNLVHTVFRSCHISDSFLPTNPGFPTDKLVVSYRETPLCYL